MPIAIQNRKNRPKEAIANPCSCRNFLIVIAPVTTSYDDDTRKPDSGLMSPVPTCCLYPSLLHHPSCKLFSLLHKVCSFACVDHAESSHSDSANLVGLVAEPLEEPG